MIQPEPYYYSYLDRFIVIPCQAIRVDEAGEQTPIDATPFRNGERLVTDGLPARHQLTRRTGAVDGVLVGGTKLEDVGSRYWCAVEREGEVLAVTRETHILVGGEPLLLLETFHLVTNTLTRMHIFSWVGHMSY